MNEKLEVEKAYLDEFNKFNEFWDKKMEEFNVDAAKLEEDVIKKHKEDLMKFEQELSIEIPAKPKDSSELLNLRKIEQQLAKQKEYIEAYQVQQKCLHLEKNENEKWSDVRKQKIKNNLQQLKLKQQNELAAIRQKIDVGKEEQVKARSSELERLFQKYQNVKEELERQQFNEIKKLEKSFKGSMYSSKMQSSKMGSTLRNSKGMTSSKMKNNQEFNDIQGEKRVDKAE